MSIHLLRQLARELDRLDLRRECAAENALDEVLDPLLKVSQNADAKLPSGFRTSACRGSGNGIAPVRAR
jgi:hypothetical protein